MGNREVLTIGLGGTGALIGAAFGQPGLGFMLGSTAGALLANTMEPDQVSEQDRISDIRISSPAYGKILPRIYGRQRVSGNIIWATEKRAHEHREETSGKGAAGGPKQVHIDFTYSMDLAVALCEGPIRKLTRMWMDTTEIYSEGKPRGIQVYVTEDDGGGVLDTLFEDYEGEAEDVLVKTGVHPDLSQKAIVFRGTDRQLPCEFIETAEGVGNVPAYLGVAYVVFLNLDLGASGRVPNFTFEVDNGVTPDGDPLGVILAGESIYGDHLQPWVMWELNSYRSEPKSDVSQAVPYDIDTLAPRATYPDLYIPRLAKHFVNGLAPATGNEAIYIVSTDGRVYYYIVPELTLGFFPTTNPDIFRGDFSVGLDSEFAAGIDTFDVGGLDFHQFTSGGIHAYRVFYSITDRDGLGMSNLEFHNSEYRINLTTGAAPTDVKYNIHDDHTYVSCGGIDQVARVDTEDQSEPHVFLLDQYINVGTNPTKLLVHTNTKVYVCNKDDGTVQHFTSEASPTVSSPITVGASPDAIIQATDAFVWVANTGDTTVSRINSSTDAVQTATLLASVTLIAPGLSGQCFAVTPLTNQVHLIDTAMNFVSLLIPRGAIGAASDVNGNLYVACSLARTLIRVNPTCTEYISIDEPNSLNKVVQDIVQRAGIESTLIDTSELDVTPVNLTIARQTTARAPLEALAQAHQFIGVETAYNLKFKFKTGISSAEIPETALSASTAARPKKDGLLVTRLDENELPTKVSVTYENSQRHYEKDTQIVQYSGSLASEAAINVNFPMALFSAHARNIAEITLYEAWAQRSSYKFHLPDSLKLLEPGDIVDVTSRGVTHLVRLTDISYGNKGVLECAGVRHVSHIYTGFTAIPGDSPDGFIDAPDVADSVIAFAEFPPMGEFDLTARILMAMYPETITDLFNSTTLYVSLDSEATYASSFTTALPAVVAQTQTVLADASVHTWDDVSTVDVLMLSNQTLSTKTDLAILNGENYLLTGKELIQFVTATLIAANTYRLSRLLRGRKGTESFTNSHAVGEKAVLYDTYLQQNMNFGYDVNRVGIEDYYKPVAFGKSITEVTAQTHTPDGTSVKPWAPVTLSEVQAGLDWVLSWIERPRIVNGLVNSSGVIRDLDVTGWIIRIYEDATYATIKRSTEIGLQGTAETTQTWTYTEAMQITDFGSSQTDVIYGVAQLRPSVEGYETRDATGDVITLPHTETWEDFVSISFVSQTSETWES